MRRIHAVLIDIDGAHHLLETVARAVAASISARKVFLEAVQATAGVAGGITWTRVPAR